MPVINRVAELHEDMTGWRRHLHRHPELAYEEVETARFVAEKLREFGVDEVHAGIGRTGVVGVLRGSAGDAAVALRADMDALPIEERSGKPWASRVAGKMHACGHDGHTTMLLGAARYLAETRAFAGTVYLVFQPAEEGAAGARAMIEDGLFTRFPAERVFGMHNWPDLPAGSFGVRAGPAMAAADRFKITLVGRGCHAAMPHQGRDPVTTAALVVMALQTIVAREVDPVDSGVVSVTYLEGGHAFNVVPDRVVLGGTSRSYRPATRDLLERRIREVAYGIAVAQGLEAEVTYDRGYPPTVNDEAEARLGAEVARGIVGDAQVMWDAPPSMGAEDFSFMLEQRPGLYIWIGQGGAAEGRVCHSPTYDFDDSILPYGVSYWARLVERCLPLPA